MEAVELISAIHKVFEKASPPENMMRSSCPETGEFVAAELLQGVAWQDVDPIFFDDNPDCVYGFSPAAFVYYLPAIMALIADGNRRHLACWNVIEMLDRPMGRSLWDEFFLERWGLLDVTQLRVIQEWLLWFSGEEDSYECSALGASFDTLEELVMRVALQATPSDLKARS
jgi:hypothetical protein